MAMALPAAFLSEDQFTCSICLEVFNNPVSTPCGHSFCQGCISSYWDGRGGAKSYQCPLCKETFRKRPELHVNLTLKEITEQFKQMVSAGVLMNGGAEVENPNLQFHQHHQPTVPLPLRPGEMPGSVFAEMMTRFQQLQTPGSPHVPLSYPNNLYLQNPNQISDQAACQGQNIGHHDPPQPYCPPLRYPLSSPGESNPKQPPCPIHMKGLEFFCRTDNMCVCSMCVETAVHRGHNITPAKREWLIKKSELGLADMKLKDQISERDRMIEEIQSSLKQIQAAAERETDGAVCVFSKLISAAEYCKAEVLKVIEMSRRTAEHRAQSLLRELEEEIAELQKRTAALSQLAVSEDFVLFLKTYPMLSTPPQTKDWSSVSMSSKLTSGVILGTVNKMMERFLEEMRSLPDFCQQSMLDQSVSRPNPRVKRVQEYADPSTAHPRLIISVDGKKVHCSDHHQLVPDNPERFDRVVCVLAHQSFNSGRHYWEVEVGGKTDWDLGVASWSVNRKGKITVSPAHGYWFLSLRDRTEYSFRTEPSTNLTVNPRPSRIGIYVDYDKGLVSFYNVETRGLIYTFSDTFSDAIHPFFSPCTNKSGRNEAPLIICPVVMSE
ncbi:E3 ubiquitin-protein ligase TRIM39-like isoform X2 [Anabas testudineus]|uniref:E3 ubiquitin-protein ligase TRIM39-like isoform X2 n=1 Tax=Anabas testudineus TaxID=64144 RepID=UPI000E45E8F1|nr:E3 ubiquitin-protein ligase TRIM39-like isoform X2 [Anabas testudineus]